MKDEEIKLLQDLVATIGYTLDAIRPSKMHNNREYEAREKAVARLEICADRVAKIKQQSLKDSSLPPQ